MATGAEDAGADAATARWRQIALPLGAAEGIVPARLVIGSANAAVVAGLSRASGWPFRTAVLSGPPRSGKSLLARLFAAQDMGDAIDDAHRADEADVFHRWNRAQESGRPLLLVVGGGEGNGGDGGGGATWRPALPDLASRLGAAQPLVIGAPDDAMMADLIALHAERRGLPLAGAQLGYLVARARHSHLAAERLVAVADRIGLERKAAPGLSIWRAALDELWGAGGSQPPERDTRR